MQDEEYADVLLKSLNSYRGGALSLGGLVDDVESIADSVSRPEYRDRIRDEWWILEIVRAVKVLYAGGEKVPGSGVGWVDVALQRLADVADSMKRSAGVLRLEGELL